MYWHWPYDFLCEFQGIHETAYNNKRNNYDSNNNKNSINNNNRSNKNDHNAANESIKKKKEKYK